MKTWLGIPREEIPWYPSIDPEKCTVCRKFVDFYWDDVFEFDGTTGPLRTRRCSSCCA